MGFFRLESRRAYVSSDESLLGNGCEEYTFWNPILADEGVSPWGWKQNALIRVDSKQAKAIFTPEYYAVKHYTRFLMPGTKVLAFKPTAEDKKPVLVVQTPEGKPWWWQETFRIVRSN